jgi:FkbM family methyltransferase
MLLGHLPRRVRKLVFRNYRRRSRYRYYNRLGLRLLLNYANYVDRQLIIHEPYEAAQLDHLLGEADRQPFDLFIDIGANFGLYALLLAHTGRFADLLAFEPDPRNFRQLVTNLALNGMSGRVHAFACGLSDRDTRIDFLQAHERSTGMSRISNTAPAGTRPGSYTHSFVPVIRLDDHFGWRGSRIMIKIDVEGHECRVISGMQQLLGENNCLLQIEMLDSSSAADALLTELGYRQYAAFGPDRLYRKNQKNMGPGHIFL